MKFKISPEDYNKILTGVDLKSISLQESTASINRNNTIPPELKIEISDESSFEFSKDNNVNVLHSYKLSTQKEGKKTQYIQIHASFLVQLTSEHEFTSEFFEIYKQVSLPLNTWPYFREYVNSITARMNILPITLPFVKRT
jgi:preprotein translocase subunit SecB